MIEVYTILRSFEVKDEVKKFKEGGMYIVQEGMIRYCLKFVFI